MEDYKSRMRRIQEKRRTADAQMHKAALETHKTNSELQGVVNTMKSDNSRTIDILNQAPAIIHDIHTQFEKATKLKGKDLAFLFGATALQTARWALLPSLDLDFSKIPAAERMTAAEGGEIEKEGIRRILAENGFAKEDIDRKLKDRNPIKRITWEKLLILPVPYDAMHGSKNIVIPGVSEKGKEIYSMNHHTATWGHDPIYGWFFGPLNITTRMISFRDSKTYRVSLIENKNNPLEITFSQQITSPSFFGQMIAEALDSWHDDGKRLFISVAKQGLHIQSDKYTKTGLPIPFFKPETAQQLLMKGWNSNEVERLISKAAKNLTVIGAQYILALIIDQLVKAIHLLCYDETVDGSIGTYSVKTQKIMCYSSGMAEVANGIYVAKSGNLSKLDIGGYARFAQELIVNEKLRGQVEAEFLEKELYRRMYGEEYYWEGKTW